MNEGTTCRRLAARIQCELDCRAAAQRWPGGSGARMDRLIDAGMLAADTIDVVPWTGEEGDRKFVREHVRRVARDHEAASGLLGWIALRIFMAVCVPLIVEWWVNRKESP